MKWATLILNAVGQIADALQKKAILVGMKTPTSTSSESPMPPISEDMKRRGLTWKACLNSELPLRGSITPRIVWREVCDFCGGNCGQCGLTGRIDNVPFDFQRIIDNATKGYPHG